MAWKKDLNGWYNNKKDKKGKQYTDFWVKLLKGKPVQIWDKGSYEVQRGGWNIKSSRMRVYARKRFKTKASAMQEVRMFKKQNK